MTIKKELLINLLIFSIPFAFIAGNLVINLNIILILLFSILFYGLKIFKEKFEIIDKVILIFFLYICANGVVNSFPDPNESKTILIKSLTYLRFLFLYFVIKFLVINNIINYKYFFLSIGAASIFVVLDLFLQFSFGKDIFGYVVKDPRRLGGPFGDELIAGGYIQRFYIFAIYFTLIFLNFRSKLQKNILIFFLISLFFLGAVIAGNRMPLVLFLMSIILFFSVEQLFRKKFLILFPIICLMLFIPIKLNKNFYDHYQGFVSRSVEMNEYLLKRFNYFNRKNRNLPNTYTKEIETGVLTWQQNKYLGGGIKSFYFNCSKIENSVMDQYGGTNCNQHPHNYYLHIASELGLFGIFFSITIFFLLVMQSLSIIFTSKINEKKILVPFFIFFLVEIFPLKTSGGFFTTTNSTFLFIIISFIIGCIQIKKIKYE